MKFYIIYHDNEFIIFINQYHKIYQHFNQQIQFYIHDQNELYINHKNMYLLRLLQNKQIIHHFYFFLNII